MSMWFLCWWFFVGFCGCSLSDILCLVLFNVLCLVSPVCHPGLGKESMLICFLQFYYISVIVFIPNHTIVVGYYGSTLDIRVSVSLSIHLTSIPPFVHSYFCFFMITSKCQWIFTKLDMCIDIVEIWFGIADWQIWSILTKLSAHHMIVTGFIITKTRLFKYTENFTTKKWRFSDKKFWYFPYFCSKHRLCVLFRTTSSRWF